MTDNHENILSNILDNQALNKISKKGFITSKSNHLEDMFDITEYLNFKKFNKIVKDFDNLFINNFPLEYKKHFYENIQTLIIKERFKSIFMKNINYSGAYQLLENRIILLKKIKDSKETRYHKLMHELLHAASYKMNLKSGLAILNKILNGYFTLGICLDEGYTEYLNNKYFSKNDKIGYYSDEQRFAYGVEKIIGKKLMQEAYFKSDLFTVIDALSEYTKDKDKTIFLIYEMDKYIRSKDPFEKLDSYPKIKNDLANLYLVKLQKDLKLGKIDEEEFTRKKFLDIYLYLKDDFMYDEKAVIIEEKDHYSIAGCFGVLKKNKNDICLPIEPDIKYNNENNNKKLVK